MKKPMRMDIWFADLGEIDGNHETRGIRPVLIVSNNISNTYAPMVTVIPMTREIKRLDLQSHVVSGESMMMAEQITTIDKAKLIRWAGHYADPLVVDAVDAAMRIFLGVEDPAGDCFAADDAAETAATAMKPEERNIERHTC